MIFNMSTGGASTADKVKYNNTESGLKSTDVQGAIDEVNSSLEDLSNPSVQNFITLNVGDVTQSNGMIHHIPDASGVTNNYVLITFNNGQGVYLGSETENRANAGLYFIPKGTKLTQSVKSIVRFYAFKQ